jgi:hypothetical protein
VTRQYAAFEMEISITPEPVAVAEPAPIEAAKPTLDLERQPTDRYPSTETASEIASALSGPLPPLPSKAALPPPLKRMASTLYETRQVAREHILNASPVLYHTESWLETLLTPTEYIPPSILLFVAVMVRPLAREAPVLATRRWLCSTSGPVHHIAALAPSLLNPVPCVRARLPVSQVSIMTAIALEYPAHTAFDDRMHTTMIGFISLLIVFRTSQAYARWWEGRTLWGAIVNSTRNLASNAACWMNDEARYTRAITCTRARSLARSTAPADLALITHPPSRHRRAASRCVARCVALRVVGTIAFAYATKQNLRGRKFDVTEMQGLFELDEILLMNQVEHIPMLMVDEIRRTMKVCPPRPPTRPAPATHQLLPPC